MGLSVFFSVVLFWFGLFGAILLYYGPLASHIMMGWTIMYCASAVIFSLIFAIAYETKKENSSWHKSGIAKH